MKVPLLDLKAQLTSIDNEIKNAVLGVIDSCQFIGGPKVVELEEAVAAYSGVSHGIGVSSGTDALLVALMGLDVGPGDKVITTPYSFFATAGAISRLGATPVFVDIDRDTYNLSPKMLAGYVEANGLDNVKAVIPVHLYGQCADIEGIRSVIGEIPIVEDAAQAIGARYRQDDGQVRRAGALGDVACFSFFPSKNLGGLGDGGMVVTDNDDLAEKLRRLKNHGGFPKYYHQLVGGNFRLDSIQAAALSVKFQHLEDWHSARQTNARFYDANLEHPAVVKPVVAQDQAFHIYNQYVISVDRRDELRKYLSDNDIGSEIYYPVPFHLQECFAELGYSEGDFPNSEHAANSTVAVPIYPEITEEMQLFVIEKIKEFYG